MGLNIKNNSSSNLSGTYKDISKDTLEALKKAAASDQKLEAGEIEEIEKSLGTDGKFTNGDLNLISELKKCTKSGNVISNLNFVLPDNISDADNFDLKIDKNKVEVKSSIEQDIANSNDISDIKNAAKAFKLATDFTDKILALKTDQQKTVIDAIKLLSKNPPKSVEQLQKFSCGYPEIVRQTLSTLGIENLKDNNEIKQFFSSKTFRKLENFIQDAAKLSVEEQKITVNVMKLLAENPPISGYRNEIKLMMDYLGTQSSMEVGKTLNKLGVFIPSTTFSAPTSEDSTSRIKTMHMGDYTSGPVQDDYIRDCLKIAKKEGFTVTVQVSDVNSATVLIENIVGDLKNIEGLSEKSARDLVKNHLKLVSAKYSGYEWAEDNKFITVGGEIKTFPHLESDGGYDRDTAIDKTLAFTTGYSPSPGSKSFTREGVHTAGLPENDPQNMVEENSIQGAVTGRNENLGAIELGRVLKKNVKTTMTYNEGGNMLTGSLPNGESYAIIGRDGLLVSTFHLEKEYQKDKKNVPDFKYIPKKVAEMEKNGSFNKELIDETVARLKSANQIPNGYNPEKRAKEFLAKVEIVKDIFPKDIGIPRKNIIFVPQPDFHVDMHMRPLHPGQVLLNDHNENIKLLQNAKAKAVKGSWEEKEIDSMIIHAQKVDKVMSPVINEIEKKLTSRGIKVIRSPGVMEGTTKQVNFMNAVPGTSLGTNRQYYITNFTTIKPIRDAFKDFMTNLDVDKVYFTGDSSGTAVEPSGSESSLQSQGGMDCRENHEEI